MKRFLPSGKEWRSAFDLLSRQEKIAFLSFFAITWLSLMGLLVLIDSRYSTILPASGGSLTEGIIGIPSKINPLLAISDADRDLSRLIFAGLMKSNGSGGLAPELADRYEISEDGLVYTFYLKENLYWHDNKPLTTDDVAFTINLAKNPKIDSPKRANWEGVNIEVVNEHEMKFHLRKPYAPFLENTTLGILPKHVWEKVPVEEFKISDLNTNPLGAGAFKIRSLVKSDSGSITQYTLERFARYRPQAPYLDTLILSIFPTEAEATTAFTEGTIEAIANITPPTDNLAATTREIRLPRIFGVFFNQDSFKPLQNADLRKALELATDRDRIIREAAHGKAIATSLPIPPGTFAYASDLDRPTFDIRGAQEILKKAGFEDTDGDGIIELVTKKEKTPIHFTLATSDTPELAKAAEILKATWHEIGVDLTVQTYEIGDLEQSVIRPREYAALLFGQVVGYDPDPFAFWHASQRNDPGLNIALYANTKVNKALEDARTTTDPVKRAELYRIFQEELAKDKPAVFLYSPLYTYILPRDLRGIELSQIPLPRERFTNIENWYRNTRTRWNILVR
ncbi:MAG: peptide ABC transporter substrate-binding protein [Patescibacteria group bacterium]